jgi:hypothetical protein
MAEVVNSLFGITPESLQADRDAALQAQALQYAKLDPFQRATAAIYSGANKLGGAVGGMLGAQDPEMMRIRQRQQLLEGADISDPKVLRERATIAMQQNDYAAAQQLASRAMDIEAKQASTAKDLAAANREKAATTPAKILESQAIAELKNAIRTLKAQPETPEIKAAIQQYEDQVTALEPKGSQTAPSELGKLLSERAALDPVKDKASYDAYTAKIKKLTTGGGIGSEIVQGLGPILGAIAKGQAQKSGEAAGTDVGKQTAAIEGKYTALNSVQDALDVVKKGIYAGGYGPLQEGLAKYSGGVLADKQRLVNTEEFRAYIGDVVIPRLTEFGGNDSVEELKYLKSVMAGETTMESKAIERILGKAKEKIQRGITRIQDQQRAIAKGEQLPTGPTGKKKTVTKTTRSGVTYTEEVEE